MPTQPATVITKPVPVGLIRSDSESPNIAVTVERPSLPTAPRRAAAVDCPPVQFYVITSALGLVGILLVALQTAI